MILEIIRDGGQIRDTCLDYVNCAVTNYLYFEYIVNYSQRSDQVMFMIQNEMNES